MSNQFDESNAKNGNDNTNGNANISISSSSSSRHNISTNQSSGLDTSHRNERSSSVGEFKRNNHRRRSSSSHRGRKTSSSPARTQLASYINRKRSRSVSQSKNKNLRSNYDSKPQHNTQSNNSNNNDSRNDLRRRIKRSRSKSKSRSRSLDNNRYPSGRDSKYEKSHNGQHLPKNSGSSFNGHSNPIDLGERINPSPNNVLAVFGLDRNATERDLYNMFEKYGCRECKIIFDKFTKAPKGFGFIYFNKVEEAVRAKEKTNGKFILDRPIRVDYSIGERDFYNKNDLAMMLQSPPHHSSSSTSYAHNTTSSYKQHYNNGISSDRLAPLPPHSAAAPPISSYRDSRHNAHHPSHRYRPDYPLHFDQFRQRSSLTGGGRHAISSKYGRRFTPSPPSTPPIPPHYDYHRQAHYQPFASNYHQAYSNPHHHPHHHHQDRNKTERRVDDRFSPRQAKRYVDSRRISTHLDVIQDQNDLAYQLRHPEPSYTKRSRSGERYTSTSSNRRYANDTNQHHHHHHKDYANGLSTTHSTQMSTQKSYGNNSKYPNEYHSRR